MCVIWLLLSCYCFGAPHTSLCEIKESLSEKGLSEISLTDGFVKSVHCVACGVTIKPMESDKIVWISTRH